MYICLSVHFLNLEVTALIGESTKKTAPQTCV